MPRQNQGWEHEQLLQGFTLSSCRMFACVCVLQLATCGLARYLPTGTRPNMLRGRNGPEYRTGTYIGCVGLCLCARLGHCTLHWLQHHRQLLAAWRFVVIPLAAFPLSDPERPNRSLWCEFPDTACQDCSVHSRRTADTLSVHWHPHRLCDRHVVRLFQRGAHRGLDTGTCSGGPASVARSGLHGHFRFMVSRECASACTLSTRLRDPGLFPRRDFWIARRQYVVHPHLGAKLKQ